MSLVLVCLRTHDDSIAVKCIEYDLCDAVLLCHVVADWFCIVHSKDCLFDVCVWNFNCIFGHNKKGINLTYTSIIVDRGEKSTNCYI